MTEEHPLIALAREQAPSQFRPGVRAVTAWMPHPANPNHGLRVIDGVPGTAGTSVLIRPPLTLDRVRLAPGAPLRLVIELPQSADACLDALLDELVVEAAETSTEDTLLRLRPRKCRSDMITTSRDLATRQGIFDHVVDALLQQGGKAPASNLLYDRELLTGDGLVCVYRSRNKRSPIGFLITDAAYGEDLELLHLYSRDVHGAYPLIDALDPRISRDSETMKMILMLQAAHDRPRAGLKPLRWLAAWRQVMERCARLWGLDASSLNTSWHFEVSRAH